MSPAERQAALDQARRGDRTALGLLCESYRPYARLIAQTVRKDQLRARMGDSDIIQDAMLEVYRGFTDFQGTTTAEFAGWLRQIVLRTLGHAHRDHLETGKRAARREQPLEGFSGVAGNSGSSPSAHAIKHEQAARVAEAVGRLPDDMQQVVLGRHVEGVPYQVLAERLGKSEGAVRVLYTRALRRLKEILGESDHATS